MQISVSLADPPNESVLLAAVRWLEGLLLGSFASAVAVLAVAAIGFLMLSGRLGLRPAATAVLGCFVLFGAATIAAGLRSIPDAASGRAADAFGPPSPSTEVPAGATAAAPGEPADDPYAGASVPGDG